MDYLNVLEHVIRLETKHFQGSSDLIEVDEWSRLVRSFNSTRCPDDYRKDIAVHFLEGDAHNWWFAVENVRVIQSKSLPNLRKNSIRNTSHQRRGMDWKVISRFCARESNCAEVRRRV